MVQCKLAIAVSALAGVCAFGGEAIAQDILGPLWRPIQQLWQGKPKNAVAFDVRFALPERQQHLADAMESASVLAGEKDQGAPSMETLLAWAREEPARLTAALYNEGYYSGRIEVLIGGQRVDVTRMGIPPPREGGPVQVDVKIEPGELFHFVKIAISYRRDAPPGDDDAGIAAASELVSGRPARSKAVLGASNRLLGYWRDRGHAFAKIVARDVVADHATRKIDVAFVIDPGPPAQFGAVEVRGAERFEEELLRSRAGIPLGEPYSPDTLKAARKRLAKLDGVRGVRIIEGDAPDSAGRIPIIIDVTERKAHYIGANAAMSSVDGAEIGGYWGHRNVFGNGESLRLDATLSNLGSKTARDLEYEAKISLTRPSIASAHTDYGTSLSIQHEAPESYDSDKSTLSVGVTHQFSPDLTGKVAVASSWIATEDAFGSAEYFLLSLPGELVYDTRDNQLDPHSGWRAALTAEPATDIRNGTAFIRTRAQLSGYAEIAKSDGIVSPESASEGTGSQWSGPQGIVAAGRIAAGTIAGADIQDVPVTSRFLAGGGGSVRGYTFRSIGPGFADEVTGGLSIVEASAELRIQVTETVGLVPFVDAAFVTGDSFFGGDSETALGVGFGLRYRTAIGPIRFDVATPLINKLAGDPEVVFYVGLGQAF